METLGEVIGALAREVGASLPLESYLENLRRHARAFAHRASLEPDELVALLRAASRSAGPRLDGAPAVTADFQAWDACLGDQIRDLAELRAAGQLDDEQRYFGLDAPRGARWFNFDPATYLECAVAGTFEDADEPPVLTWPTLTAFLEAGRLYE